MAKGSGGGDHHPQASIAGVVLMRLFLGAFFLFMVFADKLVAPDAFIHALAVRTGPHGLYVAGNQWPAFGQFLAGVVHPNAQVFGWLVIIAELLVGVMLLVGLLTRLAAFGALSLALVYLLATLHLAAGAWGINTAFAIMALSVLIAAAGRTWGLDALIAKRTRFKPLW